MILNLSISNHTKSTNSIQLHDYYNTFEVTPFSEYDVDDENDSVDSTIPRHALDKKILLQSNNGCINLIIKKSVRFNDTVESFPSLEPAMTEEEKHSAWYSVRELQVLKKHAKLYAKFVRTIDSETMNEFLNDMSFDVDDDTNEKEIICLRGLENFVSCHQTSSDSSSTRQRMLVQNILLEQMRQKNLEKRDDSDNHEDNDYISSSNDEQIRKISMTMSKICRDFAFQIAQKSYCIPACSL